MIKGVYLAGLNNKQEINKMKKLILVAAMSLSFGAMADPCLNTKKVASAIMEARQGGVPADTVIKLANESSKTEAVLNVYVKAILHAYSLPKYKTKKYQVEAVNEFANEYYIACWKGAA